MSLHVLAYNLKRLMTSLGIADMTEAVRAYALSLALQPMPSAIAVPPQSGTPETQHSCLSGLTSRTTRISMYSSAA
jgi:hypothetical protein